MNQPMPEQREIIFAILKGVIIGFVILIILLFFVAIGVSQNIIAPEDMQGASLVTILLSALIGGVYTLSVQKKQGILVGIIVGFLLFLLLFSLGLTFYPQESSFRFPILLASVCGGAMSKIFVMKKKKMQKNTKKS